MSQSAAVVWCKTRATRDGDQIWLNGVTSLAVEVMTILDDCRYAERGRSFMSTEVNSK